MKILVACEESQAVTKEFRKLGHEAFSCDILPCSGGHPEWHLQLDVTELLKQKWDMIIAFPPCTDLTVSGARWFKKKRENKSQEGSIEFFMQFIKADCERVAVENPIGIISGKYISKHFPKLQEKYKFPIKPTQIIQPWQFGHGETKSTCLWLKGLPKLSPTDVVEGREPKIWLMTDSKGKKLGWNTPEIKKARSKTYSGIAKAMATQWNF